MSDNEIIRLSNGGVIRPRNTDPVLDPNYVMQTLQNIAHGRAFEFSMTITQPNGKIIETKLNGDK